MLMVGRQHLWGIGVESRLQRGDLGIILLFGMKDCGPDRLPDPADCQVRLSGMAWEGNELLLADLLRQVAARLEEGVAPAAPPLIDDEWIAAITD